MIKKILLRLVILFAVLLAIDNYANLNTFNRGIKLGVENFAQKLTQTPVTVESADLSILSGSGKLKGINIANPEGYSREKIFTLGQIDFKVNWGSLISDQIIIEHIIIKEPKIRYEKTLTHSNLKQLLKNIEEFTEPKDAIASEGKSGATKDVIIKKLIIEDGEIFAELMGVGQTVALPRIEMSNLGGKGRQKNIVEALNTSLETLLKNINPPNISNLGKNALNNLLNIQGSQSYSLPPEKKIKVNSAVNKATEGLKDWLKYAN